MSLEEVLEDNRITFYDIEKENWRLFRKRDFGCNVGMIAEQYANFWLQNCEGISFYESLPSKVAGYLVEYIRPQILVSAHHGEFKRNVHEYDSLFKYAGVPYFVEVKSNKPGGYASKISRALDIGRKILNENEVKLLLLMPLQSLAMEQYATKLENNNPELSCVDIGFTKPEIDLFVRKLLKHK